MQFTVGVLSRCGGLNHIDIPITLGSGKTGVLHVTAEELRGGPPDDFAEARQLVLDRCRSAAKEAGATNWQQLKTALETKTFQV